MEGLFTHISTHVFLHALRFERLVMVDKHIIATPHPLFPTKKQKSNHNPIAPESENKFE